MSNIDLAWQSSWTLYERVCACIVKNVRPLMQSRDLIISMILRYVHACIIGYLDPY
jgi:hypothetical protein